MELYAVKYGVDFKYATYRTIYRGNPSDEIVPGFIFLYYIAKYKDKVILFDTGFRGEEDAENYGVNFIEVEEELKQIFGDVKVDVIFITHTHFDHTDNLDLYPDTEIVISKPEFDEAMSRYSESIRSILSSDKVHIIQEEYLYEEKFLFKVIGGHTLGSSVIYFNDEEKQYVIAGDEVYFIDNVKNNIPNGNVCDCVKNENFIMDAHKRNLITLPYHDNKVMENYIPVTKNIVKII